MRRLFALALTVAAGVSLSAGEVPYVEGEPADADWARVTPCATVPANPAGIYGAEIVRRHGMDHKVFEETQIRLLWNKEFLFVRFDATDSDIVAQSTEDQGYLFVQGDAVEIFLKPENEPYYWELYGDVSNRKTAVFIPSRGRLGLPENRKKPDLELSVDTRLDGTLNDMSDRDKGWVMTIRIPLAGLTRRGAAFGAGTRWKCCFVRYNYSCHLPMWERTVYPCLSGEPHLYEEYADLVPAP